MLAVKNLQPMIRKTGMPTRTRRGRESYCRIITKREDPGGTEEQQQSRIRNGVTQMKTASAVSKYLASDLIEPPLKIL
nr:uncharacterized protein LOC116428879 isoform X3 [Nomia melanderi]